MNRKITLPLLALALAITACQFQTASPTPTPPAIPSPTITTEPPATETNTPLPLPALTMDMLKNGTYQAPVYGRTVTLANGAYSNGSTTDPYAVQMLDLAAFGDLNGDGVADAAVLLVENSGGTGSFVSVIPILNDGGAPSQAGGLQLGDRVQVKTMKIDSGTLSMDMLVQGPNDPMCCPSLAETQTIRMVGTSFWERSLTSLTPTNQVRSIRIDSPADNDIVTSPFTVKGSVTIAPFENTLAYRLFLPDGTKVNDGPVSVDSSGVAGGPGTFTQTFDLSNASISGPVIVQFLDISAADGNPIAIASVIVNVH